MFIYDVLLSQADFNSELLKIRNYRAPRDKVICILNCCKVIFGMDERYLVMTRD